MRPGISRHKNKILGSVCGGCKQRTFYLSGSVRKKRKERASAIGLRIERTDNPFVTFIFYSVIFGSGCFRTPSRIPEGFELVIDIAVSFVFNLSGQENLIHSLFRTYWRMQRLRDVREALQLFCIIFPPQQKRQHIYNKNGNIFITADTFQINWSRGWAPSSTCEC